MRPVRPRGLHPGNGLKPIAPLRAEDLRRRALGGFPSATVPKIRHQRDGFTRYPEVGRCETGSAAGRSVGSPAARGRDAALALTQEFNHAREGIAGTPAPDKGRWRLR